MIIPSKYRNELKGSCFLTKSQNLDKCLDIYSAHEWENLTQKLSELPTSDANRKQFMRHFYACANECEIDRQGRIIIPQDLREYAGIEKDLITVGVMEKIEVWDKNEWDNAESSSLDVRKEIAKKMTEYGV